MDEEEINKLKEAGNELFKKGDLAAAIDRYTMAIDKFAGVSRTTLAGERGSLLSVLLGNRAACRLKLVSPVASPISLPEEQRLQTLNRCIEDCDGALELNPVFGKALYRKAQALLLKPDSRSALKELGRLLHVEPKNAEAIALMRQVKAKVEAEQAGNTEVFKILTALRSGDLDDKRTDECFRALIGLCADDSSHARDFGRNSGIRFIAEFIESPKNADLIVPAVQVLSAAANHEAFVANHIEVLPQEVGVGADSQVSRKGDQQTHVHHLPRLIDCAEKSKLNFVGVCGLMGHENPNVAQAAVVLTMRILKHMPLSKAVAVSPPSSAAPLEPPIGPGEARVEELPLEPEKESDTSSDNSSEPPPPPSSPPTPSPAAAAAAAAPVEEIKDPKYSIGGRTKNKKMKIRKNKSSKKTANSFKII